MNGGHLSEIDFGTSNGRVCRGRRRFRPRPRVHRALRGLRSSTGWASTWEGGTGLLPTTECGIAHRAIRLALAVLQRSASRGRHVLEEPDWWDWPFVVTGHATRRMREREIAYVELHTMLATVLVASALQWREPNLEDSAEWITLILVVLWMTWLFSARCWPIGEHERRRRGS